MRTNNHKIVDYDAVLDKKYGKVGTKERVKSETEALNFYASQIILQNRKECNLTQKELALRTGIDKSYVSRIETGVIQPTVATFIKIMNAMGKSLEILDVKGTK